MCSLFNHRNILGDPAAQEPDIQTAEFKNTFYTGISPVIFTSLNLEISFRCAYANKKIRELCNYNYEHGVTGVSFSHLQVA